MKPLFLGGSVRGGRLTSHDQILHVGRPRESGKSWVIGACETTPIPSIYRAKL